MARDVASQEVRRSGDGMFYVVDVDKNGHSTEVYAGDKLLTFTNSLEAKDYVVDNALPRRISKRTERSE